MNSGFARASQLSALARWRNQAAKPLSGRFYRPGVASGGEIERTSNCLGVELRAVSETTLRWVLGV